LLGEQPLSFLVEEGKKEKKAYSACPPRKEKERGRGAGCGQDADLRSGKSELPNHITKEGELSETMPICRTP